MGWIKRVPPPPEPHLCNSPDAYCNRDTIGEGSLWACDECGQKWYLRDHIEFGRFWIRIDA